MQQNQTLARMLSHRLYLVRPAEAWWRLVVVNTKIWCFTFFFWRAKNIVFQCTPIFWHFLARIR